MSEYIGKECLICKQKFTQSDEIVVCPECGTPYHRECYNKVGKCINTTLHEQNKSWKSVNEEHDNTETVICSKCGTINPKNGLFCKKCGNPINVNNTNYNTFESKGMPNFQNINDMLNFTRNPMPEDSELDGIKIRDYNKYLGPNSFYYLMNFINFSKNKTKVSLNFSVIFFPDYYFFYRKMYLLGSIFLLLRMIVSFPILVYLFANGYFEIAAFENINFSLDNSETILSIMRFIFYGASFVMSIFSNWIYFQKVKKDITQINSLEISDVQKSEKIIAKGGTSFISLAFAILSPIVIFLILLFIVNL